MRILLLLCMVLSSGCLFEPGLGSSPTKCPASVPIEDGFLVTIDQPERFIGYCMEIARAGPDIDHPFAYREVPADGRVYLPVQGAGRYYIHVGVEWADDKYCADHVGEFRDHNGTGLVEVDAEAAAVCA